jgi:energy-coupling factor transporter transmembrane protein EcfT
MTPDIILTALLLAATIGLYTLGNKLKQQDVAISTMLLFFMYLALVWLPPGWRDGLMGLCVILIGGAAGSFVGGIIFAAIVYGVGTLMTGGMSALLLIVVTLFVMLFVYDSVEHLKRIKRAKNLEPGKIPDAEVGIGGVIEATRPISSPLPDVVCAAWWFKMGDAQRNSSAELLLKSKELTSIIDLNNIRKTLGANNRTLEGEELKKFINANNLSLPEIKQDETGTLEWIEEGKEAYLIGIPTWESRQEGGIGQYRDNQMTAVFRSTPEQQCYLANHSKDDVYRGAIWDLAMGIGSVVQCSLIVGFQLFLAV